MAIFWRVTLAILSFFLCALFGIHWNKTIGTEFSKGVSLEPRFTRFWVRKSFRVCSLCSHHSIKLEPKRVARDWAMPERLF